MGIDNFALAPLIPQEKTDRLSFFRRTAAREVCSRRWRRRRPVPSRRRPLPAGRRRPLPRQRSYFPVARRFLPAASAEKVGAGCRGSPRWHIQTGLRFLPAGESHRWSLHDSSTRFSRRTMLIFHGFPMGKSSAIAFPLGYCNF